MSHLRSKLIVTAAMALCAPVACAQLAYVGVNLAGAEFAGHSHVPGVYGQHYGYPNEAEVDYFQAKGMNTFRLPFLWERLQPKLNEPFNEAEFGRLDAFVKYATQKGAHVILDPHNYARYNKTIIGTGDVPNSAFADLWSRLAETYKGNSRVIFGLVNEPHSMPSTELWVESANAAIAAIRNTGAKNLILVPGNAWSGAHSWTAKYYGTPNGVAMQQLVDPGNNCAFDVHQYLDTDSSGTKDVVVSPTVGAQRLAAITKWLKENGKKAFLGEFAVANSRIGDDEKQVGDEAINGMLDFMEANSDVWLGWTWWSAGPRWGEYMFTIEPKNLGKPDQADRPAMKLLESRLKRAAAIAK